MNMSVMTDFAFAGSARSLELMLFTVLRSTRSCSEWLLDWDNDTPRVHMTASEANHQRVLALILAEEIQAFQQVRYVLDKKVPAVRRGKPPMSEASPLSFSDTSLRRGNGWKPEAGFIEATLVS